MYREVLDAGRADRAEAALRRVEFPLAMRPTRREGISPHAPYTTSAALLRGARRVARSRRLPVTVHWAETEAEGAWLRRGAGPLAALLGSSPRLSGLDLLDAAGLLGKRTSLAHGNHPGRGEPARLAAAGCVLVHCPGTHAFFGREPFPWRRYRRARVPIALGTDSLASNTELDMRHEMTLLRRGVPELAPWEVFDMATTHAARATGLGGAVGRLAPGFMADVVCHRITPDGLDEALELVTTGSSSVAGVWVHGRRVLSR